MTGAPREQAPVVPLGVVTGAHGLRGELQVKLLNPASELLATLEHVTLQREGLPDQNVTVRSAREHRKGLWLVALADCRDRDAAEALRGARLSVPRSALPALPQDEHYLIDLTGLEARSPDGRALGRVLEAIEYPAAHVLRVRVARGTLEVPMWPPYLVEVRIAEGVVIVDQLDDLELQPETEPARN
jgi:16S rRNA processing protein RimM